MSADATEGVVVERRRRRWPWVLLVLLLICAAGFVYAIQCLRAGFAASDGRAALTYAKDALRREDVTSAQRGFATAERDFHRARSDMHAMGPLLSVGHVVPMLRVQLRGLETMTDVGGLLSRAGLNLTDASARVLHEQHDGRPLRESLGDLQGVATALHEAVRVLSEARHRTSDLDSYRLLGPLAGARNKLERELDDVDTRATDTDLALKVALWIADPPGGTSRRLLVVSQNPEEVRPLGGFIGTYGVVASHAGSVRLERYASIGPWVRSHPQAVVPAAKAPRVFRLARPPQPQQLANVNASPDWPSSARLAMTLWRRGGERPVDGVVSLMPQAMARIVGVLGPVHLTRYHVLVTQENLVRLVDAYTHGAGAAGLTDAQRKQFVVDLAHAVVQRVSDAPSGHWLGLGRALEASFRHAEMVMWSDDAAAEGPLSALGWSGAVPSSPGDFLADAEFEYAAKNGAALHRQFTHTVVLRPDGSGSSITQIHLRDSGVYDSINNPDSLSYVTMYGPAGAELGARSNEGAAPEPALNGHPAVGYLCGAAPQRAVDLSVEWVSPRLALPRTDGSLLYTLDLLAQPGHLGDTLKLTVRLPAGWEWAGPPPPEHVRLDAEFSGAWVLRRHQ